MCLEGEQLIAFIFTFLASTSSVRKSPRYFQFCRVDRPLSFTVYTLRVQCSSFYDIMISSIRFLIINTLADLIDGEDGLYVESPALL
jgi:hypothetical protein